MESVHIDSFREDQPLIASIAIATRAVHARVNRLIIARLPLALPPHAGDPALYLSGILHIAPIYTTFEAQWQSINTTAPQAAFFEARPDGFHSQVPDEPKSSEMNKLYRSSSNCERVQNLLKKMYLPGLMRSERLRTDIRAMTGWSDRAIDEQLQAISRTGHLAEFVGHIARAVTNRPHVLLAYSYIMYMALFAGGRFIAASLEAAGQDFWNEQPSPENSIWHSLSNGETADEAYRPSPPVRFFHFDTLTDGEDLKQEYKQRLADSEVMLTTREKRDIVQEAVCIFENIILLTAQLDLACSLMGQETMERSDSVHSFSSILGSNLFNRFRDSIVVTKERRERAFAKTRSARQSSASSASAHLTSLSEPEIQMCPALKKSVRFEAAPTCPVRSREGSIHSGTSPPESLNMASIRLQAVSVVNWMLVAVVGIMFLGAMLTGHRGTI
ncbi:hypothetical protein DCS_02734 [Drechmeria coniospora]|uniref:Heme oxygenase n=1 Tax=Drechmeria coniospora TaxID=98403 RepID=A0A151GWZ8_DRECN|nr:hypothetical protein DCS_02734 [Drechmeria coniospora]KYK61591.1 hypothetical protein DCS_02734 [Drechmeria coniospora]